MARFSLAVFCLLSFLDCNAVLAATTFGQAGDGVPTLHYDHETQIVSLDPDGLSLGLFLVSSKSKLLATEEITLPESYWVTIAPQVTGYAANDFFIETDEGFSTVGYIDQPLELGRLASPEVSFAELLADLKFVYSLGPGTPNLVGDLTSTLPYEYYESEIEAIHLAKISEQEAAAEQAALAEVQRSQPVDPPSEVAKQPEPTKGSLATEQPEEKSLPINYAVDPVSSPSLTTQPINRGRLLPSEQILRKSQENDWISVGNVYCTDCGTIQAIDTTQLDLLYTLADINVVAVQPTPVPEPVGFVLLLSGMAAAIASSRRYERENRALSSVA